MSSRPYGGGIFACKYDTCNMIHASTFGKPCRDKIQMEESTHASTRDSVSFSCTRNNVIETCCQNIAWQTILSHARMEKEMHTSTQRVRKCRQSHETGITQKICRNLSKRPTNLQRPGLGNRTQSHVELQLSPFIRINLREVWWILGWNGMNLQSMARCGNVRMHWCVQCIDIHTQMMTDDWQSP